MDQAKVRATDIGHRANGQLTNGQRNPSMTLIAPQDESTIRLWAADQNASVILHIARGGGAMGETLARYCDELRVWAPCIQLRKGPDDPFREPAIIVGRHRNIAYQALPSGKLLPSFLEVLGAVPGLFQGNGPSPSPIELPADLMLFVAPQCPHCPQTAAQLLGLAQANPSLRLAVIDGTLFTGQAEACAIRAVPTLILDDQLRWTGTIDLAEVIRQCSQRDPSQLSATSLRQIIESGEAARVAALMGQHQRIFPAFIDLLAHPRWPVRLGAMVVAEYLCGQSPDLAVALIEPLWQRFGRLEEPVQGDVVQVLAQIKDPKAKARLEQIAAGAFAESVRQAALEELNPGAA
jgi:hypothetical protein